MLLSCICFGIGEALLLAAFAGTAGLGAHAATCKPQPEPVPGVDPTAPTCCGHDHHPPAPVSDAAAALTPEGLPGSTTDYDPNVKPRFLERQGSPGMSSALRTTTLIALIGFATFMVATCSGSLFGHAHDHSADTDAEPCVHDPHEVVHEHVG